MTGWEVQLAKWSWETWRAGGAEKEGREKIPHRKNSQRADLSLSLSLPTVPHRTKMGGCELLHNQIGTSRLYFPLFFTLHWECIPSIFFFCLFSTARSRVSFPEEVRLFAVRLFEVCTSLDRVERLQFQERALEIQLPGQKGKAYTRRALLIPSSVGMIF